MSRQAQLRRLAAVEAQLSGRVEARRSAVLEALSDEELDELERLMESDPEAAAQLWSQLEESYSKSGAGV